MIVLASQSPARQAMLTAAGIAFEAVPAHVDESSVLAALVSEGADALRIADALAELKAVKVSRQHPGRLVLGADSVVVAPDGTMLEKPGTRARAELQLRQLAGATHRLVSAAVMALDGVPVWRAADSVRLTMRPLSDAFIAAYLDAEGEAVLYCVGTYRIECLGAQLFLRIDGDHFTIRGLPLLAILNFLRRHGELPS
jgi:septum formation protein